MMLVVITYGCKVPAGIFVPSMAIGATFGRMVGIFVKVLYKYESFGYRNLQKFDDLVSAYPKSGIFAVCKPDGQCITPGTYAFLGAAAALRSVIGYPSFDCADPLSSSGVMRMTVTVVVIMFEVTGALNYILPTMVNSLPV